MGAGALDQRLAVVDQRVELDRERLAARPESGPRAGASVRRGSRPAPARCGAAARARPAPAAAGRPAGRANRMPSASDSSRLKRWRSAEGLRPVAGDRVEQRRRGIRQGDRLAPAAAATGRSGRRCRWSGQVAGGRRHGQVLIPEGGRAIEHLPGGVDLPVPARERLGEARLAELQPELQAPRRIDLAAGDQALEHHPEPAVEVALDGVAEQRPRADSRRRSAPARTTDRRSRPGGRRASCAAC